MFYSVAYCKMVFQTDGFTIIQEAIKVDANLKVQLKFREKPFLYQHGFFADKIQNWTSFRF